MAEEKRGAEKLGVVGVGASTVHVALSQLTKYGGLQALGAIMSSRKGIFGILAIVVSYWMLLGRLPVDAPAELVARMGEVFGWIVCGVSGMFIGGTALEDGLSKKAKASQGR